MAPTVLVDTTTYFRPTLCRRLTLIIIPPIADSIRPLALIAVRPFTSFVVSVVGILSSFVIVPAAVPPTIVAPTGFDSVSVKFSFGSYFVSPRTLTAIDPED